MTKEEMLNFLNGKVEEAKKPDEKALFSHKCCHISKEQGERLSEMAFLADKQESCRQLSHFIGENMGDDGVKAVLQGHVICIGEVLVLSRTAIIRECIAFCKAGFLTYAITIEPRGIGLALDRNVKLKVYPWPQGVFMDGYIAFCVRERRKEIKERVAKCWPDTFRPCPDEEIADVILKGAAEVQS